MALLSADQVEAIHLASMHILENFGIEVMNARALALFERAGAKVDHATMNVRVDRGMVEEALKAAQKIADFSLPAAMMAKEAVNRAYETTLAEGLRFERRLFHSMFALEDQKEGMAAFAEKRKPNFVNR